MATNSREILDPTLPPDTFWQRYLADLNRTYLPASFGSASAEKTALIYTRVSTEEQLNGYSLEEQERECRLYAQHKGWTVSRVYRDEGHSGTNIHRPGYQQLIQESLLTPGRLIIIHKLDRLHRNAENTLNSFSLLRRSGVALVSVREQIDFTTPWGKLIFVILAMLAEIFVDNLRDETRKGKLGRFHAQLHNGPLPFGYCNGKCSRCEDLNGPGYCYRVGLPDLQSETFAVPHPLDSLAFQYACRLYSLATYTDKGIADALNEFKVQTPEGVWVQVRSRGKAGQKPPGPFSKDMVADMLQNVFYTGAVVYYGSQYDGQRVVKKTRPQDIRSGRHLALISPAEFEHLRTIRQTRSKAPQGEGQLRQQSRVYLLSGLLDCHRCGAPLHSQAGGVNQVRRHLCWTRTQRSGSCDQPSVKADVLEAALLKQLSRLTLPPEWQEEVLGYLLNEAGLGLILARRRALQEHFEAIREKYEREELTRQIYRREWLAYEAGMAALSLDTRLDLAAARHLLADFPQLWERLTAIEQKQIVQALLHKAIVDDQQVIEWRWYTPFKSLFQK